MLHALRYHFNLSENIKAFTYLKSFHRNLLLHKPRVIFYNDRLKPSRILIEYYFVRENLVGIKGLETNGNLTQSSFENVYSQCKNRISKRETQISSIWLK